MNSVEKQRIILRELRSMPNLEQRQSRTRQIRELLMEVAQRENFTLPRKKIRFPTVLTGATAGVAAIFIAGTFVYNLVASHQANPMRLVNSMSPPQQHASEVEVKGFYNKMLGFLPRLPSYLPVGMKVSYTSAMVGKGMTNAGRVFYIDVAPQKSSGAGFTIFETTVSQLKGQLKGNSSLKEVAPQDKGKQDSNQASGTAVAEYSTPGSNQIYYVLTRNGIAFGLEPFKGSSRTEAAKILASCTLPEQEKPQTTQVYSKKSVRDVQPAVPFRLVVPKYLPGHFQLKGYVVGQAEDSQYGKSFHADFGYQYKGAVISIDEQLSNMTGTVPENSIPAGALMENLVGHKVYVHMTTQRAEVSEIYQWHGDNGVLFTVTSTNPEGRAIVDKAMLKKVVASMLN